MTRVLPAAFWLAAAAIVLWDIQLAGRIAQHRGAPRGFARLSGLAGLLVLPAAIAAAAAPSLFVGRAVEAIAWLWPAIAALCTVQVAIAVARRHVTPAVGIPFLLFDVVVTAAAVARYATLDGGDVPAWLLGAGAAQAGALGTLLGEVALWSPAALVPPLIAPISPARWRLSATMRAGLAVTAAAWAGLVLVVEYPRAVRAVNAFAPFAEEELRDRPAGDLALGLQLFPTLAEPPTELMLRNDGALADSLLVSVVGITIAPEAATIATLDSLARLLQDVRRDTTLLVVSLGYPRDAARQHAASPDAYHAARVADVRRIVRTLRPDVLLPAVEPYGLGARVLGELPLETWQRYLSAAAAVVQEDRPRTLVGVSASSFGARDSALFAWAADRASPMELVGFAIRPGFDGGLSLAARLSAADRWLAAEDPTRAPKPHWIFQTAAFPLVHGERGQRDALWGVLAWASARPQIRALVVADAADYDRISGLRVTGGRLRPAVEALADGVRLLRETAQ